DTNVFLRYTEDPRQFFLNTKGSLCTCPHRKLAVLPLDHAGAGLQRCVCDVVDVTGLRYADVGLSESACDFTLGISTASRGFLQVREDLLSGGMRLLLPLSANGGNRTLGRGRVGSGDRHKITVVNDHHIPDISCSRQVDRREDGAV